jgi:hypothetical protein
VAEPLSPAAQAVLDAYGHCQGTYEAQVATACSGTARLAAALRAAADQVVPPSLEAEFCNRNPSLTLQKAVEIRADFLALATELDPTP